ncbi:hypothetical protein MTR67_013621 [Solanum verrucosum]|uniref:Pectinesterase inhibitor domain-containing protein n=1 Tax=Solanum verrucosum TaxID=315347 RepID=A0AAF0QBJ8_SOLVR|nr:hypothetical protein MTR67_013621 [Solanum verrucosum]
MPYASSVKTNSMRLCEEAVKVAIKGARSASVIISNLSKEKGLSHYEAKTTKVCIKSVKNSVHQFRKSVKAIGDMIGSCIDGFADQLERKINPNVKKKGYEAVATKDCIRAVKTAVYQLKETVKVLGDKESQLHDAISYTTAASTNAEECIDGFTYYPDQNINPNVKKVIHRSMTVIKTLAIIALTLIDNELNYE